MFGNNPKRSIVKGDGKILYVQEIFATIQGEGLNSGIASVFIRLGGCNLACSFCDTEFENFKQLTIDNIINNVVNLSKNEKQKITKRLVVITGGEPLRQPIGLLCQELLNLKYQVQIETNGTLYQILPDAVEIICSPKVIKGKYILPHPNIIPKITAFKFLISHSMDGYNTVPPIEHYQKPILVQPMDEIDIETNRKNTELAVDLVLNYGYRLSYQIHKAINIP